MEEEDNKALNKELLSKAEEALDKAKFQLMNLKHSTFTSSILFQLSIIFTNDVKGAMVDIEKIQLNPEYFTNLDAKSRISLLAKLSWHIAYNHPNRYQELEDAFEFGLFSQAADHSVNTMLKDKGYHIPDGWHADKEYKDMFAEQIYKYLEAMPNPPPSNEPQFSNSDSGGNSGNPNPPQMSSEQMQQRQEQMLAKAAMENAREDGDKQESVGQDILDRVAEYYNPKVPWNVVFRNYMHDTVQEDYTYRKPNMLYLQHGLYMPSLHSEGITDFGIGIDVSGSISQEEFNAFKTESQSMKDILKPLKTEVIQWHHNIADIAELDSNETLEDVEFNETGGTDVHPLLNHWIDNPPKVAVIFTDGYFHPFNRPEDINFPVIWVIHTNKNFNPEFGKVIYYEPDLD